MDSSHGRQRIVLPPFVEEVAVFAETDGKVLAEFERKLVHAVVMLLEVAQDPLILFLGWEWCLFVKWQFKRLVADEFKVTAYIEHLFLAD